MTGRRHCTFMFPLPRCLSPASVLSKPKGLHISLKIEGEARERKRISPASNVYILHSLQPRHVAQCTLAITIWTRACGINRFDRETAITSLLQLSLRLWKILGAFWWDSLLRGQQSLGVSTEAYYCSGVELMTS